MSQSTPEKYLMLAGASAVALGWLAPMATAQDAERKLGTVLVTTQKTEESIQDVPIAVSAFDEEALEKLQLAGGPDLVKTIPNVAFTAGNFGGFNFKIRGIGADLIATSGDAGVGIHQNDVPLTANRLLEAEFFDMERVETLRGPQGTLYGRNATAGVVNIITAKPVYEEFQGDLKLTAGNFNTFKAKGMVNVPIGERVAFRAAGSLLQRDGYIDNVVTGNDVDSRDLYSIRATLAAEPTDFLRGWVSYEHFEEEDSRIRSGKQLCKKDPFITEFAGVAVNPADYYVTTQSCQEAPLSESYERSNSAGTLGGGFGILTGLLSGDVNTDPLLRDLRKIEADFDPTFYADQDLITWKAELDIGEDLMLTYLGSQNETSYISVQSFTNTSTDVPFNDTPIFPGGVVPDPQLGTSNVFRTFDQQGGSTEQTTHELRLQSDYDGRFNFNLGAISLDFETIDPTNPADGYYVFSNSLTALALTQNFLVSNGLCTGTACPLGAAFTVPIDNSGDGEGTILSNTNGLGGNYFRSLSPYRLESFAVFGEGYFDLTDNLQLTVGLRYTNDKKEQDRIPSQLFSPALPDPLAPQPIAGADPDNAGDGSYNANFEEVTGRAGIDWSPDLSFTEDSLLYAFYSRGYKGGGINPPQPADNPNAFPQTFDPEFINSYEIGTKNTLAGGALQLNATGFLYDYEGYQVSQIINRSSANFNIDAKIQGIEIESIWNPTSTLVLNANLGLLNTEIQDTYSLDVLDRTNGRDDIMVIKSIPAFTNCVVTTAYFGAVVTLIDAGQLAPGSTAGMCTGAVGAGLDAAYVSPADGASGLAAFRRDFGIGDVTYVNAFGETVTIDGTTPFEGEAANLDGNSIPNAPEMTLSAGAEYTFESMFGGAWNMRLRGDYYYQGDSFSRVYNTGRDELESWTNLNLSVQFYNDDLGVELEIFGKNVLDEEVITGAYLPDDNSGLFSNIFLTDPRLYGVSVRKSF